MSDTWYYTHAGQTLGPVTAEQLRQLACSDLLVPEDLVWPEGCQQNEAVPAQACIDFQTTAAPIVKKPDWLDDLRAATAAEPKPVNSTNPPWLDNLRAPAKAEQKSASPAKANWLDDVGTAEKEEREKDKKRRSRPVEKQPGEQNCVLNVEPVKVRSTSSSYGSHKVVLRSKTMVSLVVLLLLPMVVGIPLLAWDAIQRERGISEEKENARLQVEAIEAYVRKANSAAQRGAWREALAGYDKALKAGYPDPVSLHLSKARAYLAINDEDNRQREMEALASFRNLGEHESSVLLLKGESLLGRNDSQAEQLIRQALEKKTLSQGEDAYARALLADTTPKAVDLLRETLAHDPAQVHARATLELLLILLARLDEARAELKVHSVLFPEDKDANVLQSLLLAAEGKPVEARKVLEGLRGKLLDNDLAAMRDLTTFLAEFRNPVHWPDPLLGLPDLSSHWQDVQQALCHLWPALASFGREPRVLRALDFRRLSQVPQANSPRNARSYQLISRLPPRLRKHLESIPEMWMTVASSFEIDKKAPNQVVENMIPLVEAHPEGTLIYVLALAHWSAGQWQEADQAALRAVETPALISTRRPALFVAAASKLMLHLMFKENTAMPLRDVEAMFVLSRPAFFGAALDVGSDQMRLFPAVENLRETLALGSYRPLLPEIAVRVAVAAREYNMARQLLDDWKREADSKAQLTILSLRTETELKAGAYGPALEAAGEYLRRKPDDSAMRESQKVARRKLIEQAQLSMPAVPQKRAP